MTYLLDSKMGEGGSSVDVSTLTEWLFPSSCWQENMEPYEFEYIHKMFFGHTRNQCLIWFFGQTTERKVEGAHTFTLWIILNDGGMRISIFMKCCKEIENLILSCSSACPFIFISKRNTRSEVGLLHCHPPNICTRIILYYIQCPESKVN